MQGDAAHSSQWAHEAETIMDQGLEFLKKDLLFAFAFAELYEVSVGCEESGIVRKENEILK